VIASCFGVALSFRSPQKYIFASHSASGLRPHPRQSADRQAKRLNKKIIFVFGGDKIFKSWVLICWVGEGKRTKSAAEYAKGG